VVGRFLYLRIHQGLLGKRSTLEEIQRKAGLAEGEMKLRLRFAPEVAERLLTFEAMALARKPGWRHLLPNLILLPIRRGIVYRQCSVTLRTRFRQIAKERRWTRANYQRRRRLAANLTSDYLRTVVRVAQFSSYERLFALWHILHVPFVYLLVLTVCFHVFAVHAY
jgi:hypothetical protein